MQLYEEKYLEKLSSREIRNILFSLSNSKYYYLVELIQKKENVFYNNKNNIKTKTKSKPIYMK